MCERPSVCGELRPPLIVLKYGGNAMRDDAVDPVLDECAALWRSGARLVLVHGGGPQIDAELARRGVVERRIAGQRVTGPQTLATVEAVLCGSVNKALVRALAGRGVDAVGVSGEDGGLLTARRLRDAGADLGFVGEVASVETRLLYTLLDAGFMPVVAPLAIDERAGCALNVNADGVAGALAGWLRADLYVNATNVSRVRTRSDEPASEACALGVDFVEAQIAAGALTGSIVPKLRGALEALRLGARRAFVCSASEPPIAGALAGLGTEIKV